MALSEKYLKPSYDEITAKLDQHQIKHITYRSDNDAFVTLQAKLWLGVVTRDIFENWHATCVTINDTGKLVVHWQFEEGKLV